MRLAATWRFGLGLALAVAVSRNADALLTFGEIQVLNSNAATETGGLNESLEDYNSSIATDGAGIFLVVWSTGDENLGAGPYSFDGRDIAYSRSTDGGRTWSDAALLYSPADSANGFYPVVRYGGGGTWIVAWTGVLASPMVTRSTDAGVTWSSPVLVNDTMISDSSVLALAGDATGAWDLIWTEYSELHHSRSVDDGQTWSTEASFPDPMGIAADATYEDIAATVSGTRVAVWNDSWLVSHSRSTDAGATWSSAVQIGSTCGSCWPKVQTDGAGTWVAIWRDGVFGIRVTRSTDDGLTWGSEELIAGASDAPYTTSYGDERIVYSDGVWQAVWTQGGGLAAFGIGVEGDIVGARSFDGGATWTDSSALNANAGRDNTGQPFYGNVDRWSDFAVSHGAGSVMAYSSGNSLGNTIGEDFDIFFAHSDDFCPSIPNPSCLTATRPGASSISYKNPLGGRDKLQWKWRYGAETLLSDFGNPSLATDYALCVYDKAGGSVRDVMEVHALAGGNCKKGPCWTATSDGWMYRDPDGRRGPLRSLQLVAGVDGSASIRLKASGPALAPPPMPLALDPSMRMQVVNVESGLCWEAEFSAASSNLATEFRATSD